MRRWVLRVAYVVIALVVGQMVVGLPWALAQRMGWTPVGPWSLGLFLGSFGLAGLAAAATYTYLNDGSDALRGVVHGPSKSHHHRLG